MDLAAPKAFERVNVLEDEDTPYKVDANRISQRQNQVAPVADPAAKVEPGKKRLK
jgi:hypothetical protein